MLRGVNTYVFAGWNGYSDRHSGSGFLSHSLHSTQHYSRMRQ